MSIRCYVDRRYLVADPIFVLSLSLSGENTVDTFANPITQVLDDFKASVLAKDVDAFVALYDPGLSIFDMWGVWSYDGIEPWRQMVERWFSSVGTDRVIVDFSDVKTIVTKELALVHAFIKYKALDTEGKALRRRSDRTVMAGKSFTSTRHRRSIPPRSASCSNADASTSRFKWIRFGACRGRQRVCRPACANPQRAWWWSFRMAVSRSLVDR
jgi:ketosteroid isomerase-like protein